VVDDVRRSPSLGQAPVLTYAAAVREGARFTGAPIGVLAVHFDWEGQARSVLAPDPVLPGADRTRLIIADRHGLVLAASDGEGALSETLPLSAELGDKGVVTRRGGVEYAYHRTPGFETYAGLGWFGVVGRRALG
jgi:hypothetical protein